MLENPDLKNLSSIFVDIFIGTDYEYIDEFVTRESAYVLSSSLGYYEWCYSFTKKSNFDQKLTHGDIFNPDVTYPKDNFPYIPVDFFDNIGGTNGKFFFPVRPASGTTLVGRTGIHVTFNFKPSKAADKS